MYDVRDMDQPEKADKGQENGSCNRRACQAPNAIWYNHGSCAWYCEYCRNDIEFDSFNLMDWQERHQPKCGHPMFETREMFEARGVTSVHTISPPAREKVGRERSVRVPTRLRRGRERKKKLFRA